METHDEKERVGLVAIGFLRVAKISRGQGSTACARLAYVLRTSIRDPRTELKHDYCRKGDADVLASGVVGWRGSAPSLAQAMSASEKRADACEGRSVILAIPHELTIDQASDLLVGWCHAINGRHGAACVWVLHAPDANGDDRNIHAHILITGRRSDGENLGEKARELDDRRTGPQMVESWRQLWGERVRESLRAAGRPESVDMRSWSRRLASEGLPVGLVEGDEHLGPSRAFAERQGRATEAGKRNRQRDRHRRTVAALVNDRAGISQQLEKGEGRLSKDAPSRLFPEHLTAIDGRLERAQREAGTLQSNNQQSGRRLAPEEATKIQSRFAAANEIASRDRRGAAKRRPKSENVGNGKKIKKSIRSTTRAFENLLGDVADNARGIDDER